MIKASQNKFECSYGVDQTASHPKGFWNANTNTPYLSNIKGMKGDYYTVDSEGVFNGEIFKINDRIEYDGNSWRKTINNNQGNSLENKSNWVYYFPFTNAPSNLFITNFNASSQVFSSNKNKINFISISSDFPYGGDLKISSIESPINIFQGDVFMIEFIYDSTINHLPEFYNDIRVRIGIGISSVETDFTGLDFSLRGNFEISSQRNYKEERVDSKVKFQNDVIYVVYISKTKNGYSLKILKKYSNEILVEHEFQDMTAAELPGLSVFPYTKNLDNKEGRYKIDIIKAGFLIKNI
ncbi:hypothetical protein [Flavobacterium columnare]|uniref:hypothetical protein n=1 Tax=Flavobacterium columnare TaxID=996 RepID=UPI004033F690